MRELWQSGKPTIGGWCTVPDSFTAELMGRAGFDWVCIDTQHGLPGQDQLVSMLQAIQISRTPAFVRVTWNQPDLIMRALDCGAQGVIIPMINTAEDARKAVGACRYAPHGYRSYGPIRASLGRPDYTPTLADTEVVCAVMIETEEAVRNIDEILSVPGVDGVYVGPSDLAVSLGLAPTGEPTERLHMEAIDGILGACQRHGVAPGIWCGSIEAAVGWLKKGFIFVNVNSDAAYVRQSAVAVINGVRGERPVAAAKAGYA